MMMYENDVEIKYTWETSWDEIYMRMMEIDEKVMKKQIRHHITQHISQGKARNKRMGLPRFFAHSANTQTK